MGMSSEMNRRQFLLLGAGAFAALGTGCTLGRRGDSSAFLKKDLTAAAFDGMINHN